MQFNKSPALTGLFALRKLILIITLINRRILHSKEEILLFYITPRFIDRLVYL